MTKHIKGGGVLKGIPLTTFHNRDKTNKNKVWWRATESSLRVGAQSEDTELIIGAVCWAWWSAVLQPEEKAFYSTVTQRQQMCLNNLLLPVINELSACVRACVCVCVRVCVCVCACVCVCVCGNDWKFISETYVQGLWLRGGLEKWIWSKKKKKKEKSVENT